MKVIIILTTLICIGTFANSESHSVSTDRQDFSNAIRFVEKKEFSAAIEIFKNCPKWIIQKPNITWVFLF